MTSLRFAIRSPEELLLAVQAEAAARKVTPSQFIKAALSESLQQKTPAA